MHTPGVRSIPWIYRVLKKMIEKGQYLGIASLDIIDVMDRVTR